MRYILKQFLRIHGIPALFSLALTLLAALSLHFSLNLQLYYDRFLNAQSLVFRNVFLLEGIQGLITTAVVLAGVSAGVFFAGAILSLVRKARILSVIRSSLAVFYGLAIFYAYGVFRITALIFEKNLSLGAKTIRTETVFYWRYDFLWPLALLALVMACLHVFSWRRRVIDLYTGYPEDTPATGDRIVENIRTHGRDPAFRKSVIYSILAHFTVIILIPFLAQFGGCESTQPYLIPEGSGNPVIGIVQVVKPKQQAKKRVVLNPNSAISFHPPNLDDSSVAQDVDESTTQTYAADAASVHQNGGRGGLGAGGGGKGGWPGGMKNAVVRFIRLEYDGEGWDDGMDPSLRSDMNFLDEFKKATGFKTASHGESNTIRLLNDYPKGFAPPFVFMCGHGQINVSPKDIAILRTYLLDGGMLFADCGSVQWDRSFHSFIQALFPGEPLLTVSDDDPIYQQPYVFANGVPLIAPHAGNKALGIKRGRRWVVYYHPGDIHDAWKIGHSGVNPELTRHAYQLGINIVYHAFTHYLEETRKYRK